MLLLLASLAAAFCGTFVGSNGELLTNNASQVVIARQGSTTTLTLAVDYNGSAAEFGLVLPVPQVVTADDVGTADPALFDRVAGWSNPREVVYTCDDINNVTTSLGGCGLVLGAGCSEAGYTLLGGVGGEVADGSVAVEASFSEAGYDFVVLSAEGAGGLQVWLDDNGFALPEGGDAILQEYIDAGAYFLAAKVSLDEAPTGEAWLPPIQVRYQSEAFGLPIRIGTISAAGPQEVLVYTLTDSGRVGVSNYPEVTVDDECLRSMDTEFAEYYARALEDAFAGEAGWTVEYGWSLSANCDPCTASTGLMPEELEALGFDGYHGWFTRLRLRYTPEQAVEDLVLYDGGDTTPTQVRYIQDAPALRDFYPVCGEGMQPGSGECLGQDRSAPFGFAAALPLAVLGSLVLLARRRA